MAFFPGSLLLWVELKFTDVNGNPLALGTIETYEAGTTTPLATYVDPAFMTANPTTIELDDGGHPPNPIYLLPQSYKIIVKDEDGNVQPHYPFDDVLDVGQEFAEHFGSHLYAGAKEVVSGYEVNPEADHLVTVQSTGGPDPCVVNLPQAILGVWPITFKNLGDEDVQLTPSDPDTVDGDEDGFTLPAAADGVLPTLTLLSDGVSEWLIVAGYGLA